MYSLLLSIVILLTVLLAIPLSISYSIIRDQQLHAYARFSCLFGLLKFQARFPGKNNTDTNVITQKQKTLTKNAKFHKGHGHAVTLFKKAKYRRHIIRFIGRLLAASHAQDLYLRCRIGLGDPADTGWLWAGIGPVAAILKNLHAMTIELEPEFINSDAVLEIESRGHFRLIPLQLIALSMAFILSPTTLQAWRTLQQEK